MNGNANVYFQARKTAARYNERLYSRDGASELLGISVSTLADYELGITKVVPVDKVVLMADLYNCPELKTSYCKCECPIGMQYPIATKVGSLEGCALRLINALQEAELYDVATKVMKIAIDGEIGENELSDLEEVMNTLDGIIKAATEMKLIGEKALRGRC